MIVKLLRAATLCALLAGLLLVASCSGSKISVVQPSAGASETVSAIAISPGSGVFGEAVGIELFNRGFNVVYANEATTILARAGLDEYEITSSKGFVTLREKGIGAVLSAKSVGAADGTPESASVRVTNTANGRLIAAVTWQNGWGGMAGSISDRVMRDNLTEAANEIAEELAARMGM